MLANNFFCYFLSIAHQSGSGNLPSEVYWLQEKNKVPIERLKELATKFKILHAKVEKDSLIKDTGLDLFRLGFIQTLDENSPITF